MYIRQCAKCSKIVVCNNIEIDVYDFTCDKSESRYHAWKNIGETDNNTFKCISCGKIFSIGNLQHGICTKSKTGLHNCK